MKIKTELLKELVTKSIKGASDNKLIPLSQLMCVKAEEGELTLITTDGTNYLYVYNDEIGKEDFYAVVMADQFAKLISKQTSEYIELTESRSILTVKGNGTYTIELPLDEGGTVIKYPDPYEDFVSTEHEHTLDGQIKLSDIKTILESVRPSLATTFEDPVYTNYYIGDNVVATDHTKIAGFDKTLIEADVTPKFLMSPSLMNLFEAIDSGDIDYQLAEEGMLFEADNCVIIGKEANGIDEFNVEAINGILSVEFPSVCKINKQDFLSLLDRMTLFVGKYDDNSLRLKFDKDGIIVTSKNTKSFEEIDYKDSKNFKEFECMVDVPIFTQQIKAYAGDTIELHYGREESIKFVDGALTQIVALNIMD